MKFTFKKHPKETGLAAVGRPDPDTDIKLNKKVVGYIAAPTWQSQDRAWLIRLAVKKESEKIGWGWISLKARFSDEKEAREFLQKHVQEITEKWQLHQFDPD